MKFLNWILDLLFPRKCILCGSLLEKDALDLCPNCRKTTFAHSSGRKTIPLVERWFALWYYEGNVRESLLRYKFGNARSYAESYGRLLGEKLVGAGADFDVLTWVPVSGKRRRKRGYDQVELLARAMGKALGVVPVQTLEKIWDNPPQSGIQDAAARRANVKGVYRTVAPECFAGKRVLLVDDIITTGATIAEAARELRTAGAKEVICAAVAARRESTT